MYPDRIIRAAVVSCLLSSWAAAQEVPPPAIGLVLGDDAAEVRIEGKLAETPRFEFAPSATGGLLAPFGGGEGTLLPSPFATAGFRLAYHGALETLAIARLGVVELDSRTLFDDPQGSASSPANHRAGQTRFHEADAVPSAYGDAGAVIALSPAWKAAVFAAGDAFGVRAQRDPGPYGGQGLVEGSVGALAMRRKGRDEISLAAAVHVEGAGRTMWRNNEYAAVPAGQASAEYARDYGHRRAAVGLDMTLQRADAAARPYVKYQENRLSMILAAEARKRRDDFYPDAVGAAAGVAYAPVNGVQVGVQAKLERLSYAMAPAPVTEAEILGTFTVDTGSLFRSSAYKKLKSRSPASTFTPGDSYAMNARLPTAADQDRFKLVPAASPTLGDFARNYGFHSIDDVLAAVSMLTSQLHNNYNDDEDHHPNIAGADNLYAAMRGDYLSGNFDPLTVCIGAAQLAVDLARQAGIPLEAAAIGVQVPGPTGNREGHGVAALKTQPYGIVFVDWGRLTPTYTWDTKQALAIYQGLQGVPTVYHDMTGGPNGRHIGYLFTEDGRKLVRGMTVLGDLPPTDLQRVFDDDPRGGPMTVDRFRDLTRAKFGK